jgi:hypothetical protein
MSNKKYEEYEIIESRRVGLVSVSEARQWRRRWWLLGRVVVWLLVSVGRLVWGLLLVVLIVLAALAAAVASVLPE